MAIWNACKLGRVWAYCPTDGAARAEARRNCRHGVVGDRRRPQALDTTSRPNEERQEHEVPLPDSALALLPERRLGRDLVFGRQGPFSGFSRAKARLDGRTGLSGRWRLHDLRHSFVTHANEIGIEPHIIEAAVNHVSGSRGGIAGRYNAAKYREPKRRALQRYAHWIEGLVSGCQAVNVLAFG